MISIISVVVKEAKTEEINDNECAQCGNIATDIEQDSDGNWYCLSCFVEYYEKLLEEQDREPKILKPATTHNIVVNECAQCGNKATDLRQDSDDNWYCSSCWEEFYDDTKIASFEKSNASASGGGGDIPIVDIHSTTSEISQSSNIVVEEDDDEEDDDEEEKAVIEAAEKLYKLKKLQNRSAGVVGANAIVQLCNNMGSKSEIERSERKRIGEEQLMRALKEEENKARKEGKVSLANALAIQQRHSSSFLSITPVNLPPVPISTLPETGLN